MKLLIFLHGYGGRGGDIVQDPAVTGTANRMGWLVVAPDGVNRSWAHVGSPSSARDDLAFVASVRADVERRWPVDETHVVAGGFSQGASMVWDLACHTPGGYTAFVPFSGAFWEPLPGGCAAPVNLRQVHGTADTTVPMTGRTLFGRSRQGDVRKGLDILLRAGACTAPVTKDTRDGLDCTDWTGCAGGHDIQLCTHGGGHEMDAAWVADSLRWADR